MKNKKTQSTMIVMAATLGMSGILQPITAYAQEEQVPDTTQPVPAQETTTITQSEDTFTEQDIQQALANFTYTNETTGNDIVNYLNKMFSGKKYGDGIVGNFGTGSVVKENATLEKNGSIRFEILMFNIYGTQLNASLPTFSFEIPSLKADYANDREVTAAISKKLEAYAYHNGTEKEDIIQYLEESFKENTFVFNNTEVRSIKSIEISIINKKEATFYTKGTITLTFSFTDNDGISSILYNLRFEVPRLQPDYASLEEVEAVITEELKAYPYHNGTEKEEIDQYLKDRFNGETFVYRAKVETIQDIVILKIQKQEATIDTNGSITLNVSFIDELGEKYDLNNLVFEIPSQYPLANIPDESFRKFLLDNVDIDGDKNLSLSERNAVETLALSKTTIEDLSGIEIFKNLKNLYCNEQVRILDVSQNDTLEVLHCSSSQITSLDLRNNPALQSLDCSGAKQLDTLMLGNHPSLKHVHAHETLLSTINTSECPSLETLTLGNTQITSVDVLSNPKLQTLALGSTQITDLDVSRNRNLTYLDLNATKKLKGIDISTNQALQTLNLNSSSLSYLNASGNTNLTMLDVENTNLAYLTLNAIPSEQFVINPAPVIQTQFEAETFNIKDIFPGIDISRISKWQNASFDKTTGIVSEYLPNTAITYEYAILPTVNKRVTPTTMKVTLQIPKAHGYINIDRASDVVYTGNPIANPTELSTLEGAAEPIFFYHMLVDGNWVPVQGNPVEVGTYRVDARVPENEHYLEAETSELVTFDIIQANNVWDKGPSIKDWTYGEQSKDVIAEARFGKVDITYSNSKTGIYTDTVPTDAGTWYMKASVEGTKNYTGLSDVVSFVIQPKNATENPDIKIPDIKDDKDLEDLVIKDGEKELEKGKDYEVDKQQKDEETTVTISFKDNYTGEVTKTYTTKKEEQKETPKEETKEEPKAELKADAIKKTGETHQGGLFGLWSTLLAGCGIVAMKKQKKEEKQ